MKNTLPIKTKKITIATYEATTGPAHDLRDYLIDKTSTLLFIAHPLLFIPSNYANSSRYELYEHGKDVKQAQAIHFILPEIFLYCKDFLYTLYWGITKIGKADVFFGVGNINAVAGLVLKKLGFVKQVIFYSIDYVPNRFQSKTLNNFYHYIDRWATEKSDVTWNLSPRMEEGRRKKWRKKLGNQITVPIGIWFDRIQITTSKRKNREIIYLGTILEKQGLDMAVKAIDLLKDIYKDIHLTIIGSGPYESVIKDLVKRYKLEDYVTFLGYLPDHSDVEKRLSQASIAFALYNPKKDIFSYFADPGKVKSYLACGLPILITDIPYIAKQVEKEKCGIIVEYNINDIVQKVDSFFSNSTTTKLYSTNARNFAKKFNWLNIYNEALAASNI